MSEFSKNVSVYLKDNSKIFIQAYSIIKNGPLVLDGPILGMLVGEGDQKIGQMVLDVIDHCREDIVCDQSGFSCRTNNLIKEMKCKNLKDMQRQCKWIHLIFEKTKINFSPSKFDGKGYSYLYDRQIFLPRSEATPTVIGTNILKAFGLCE